MLVKGGPKHLGMVTKLHEGITKRARQATR